MSQVKKSYPVHELKAGTAETGLIEAVVSVFGNVDLVGDRVVPGAFTKTIADWKAKSTRGRFLPFTDEHDWSREGRIGKVIDMAETPEGLLVKAKLFMEQQSAREVFNQVKEGVLSEFSFAYDVIRERKNAQDGANDLLQLELLDASTALHGANSETRLVSVKADDDGAPDHRHLVEIDGAKLSQAIALRVEGAKVGRAISAKRESIIRAARDALDEVLSDVAEVEAEAPEAKVSERPMLEAARLKLAALGEL